MRLFERVHTISRGTTFAGLSGHFFRMFEIKSFCVDVVLCDLEQDLRTIHGIC